MANEKQDFGTIIEQWFKRFELIAKDEEDVLALTKGDLYPVMMVDLRNKQIAVGGDHGYLEWYTFEQVPDYFEIRIREA